MRERHLEHWSWRRGGKGPLQNYWLFGTIRQNWPHLRMGGISVAGVPLRRVHGRAVLAQAWSATFQRGGPFEYPGLRKRAVAPPYEYNKQSTTVVQVR
jgi:hypothetical protein